MRNVRTGLLAVLVSFLFALFTIGSITETPLRADDHQNARMAYYLATSGVISYASRPDQKITPTMRREPFPIVVHALFYLAHPYLSADHTMKEVVEGAHVVYTKQINILWSFVLFCGIFSLSRSLFKSDALSFAIGVFSIIASLATFTYVRADRLFTELPASALMIWASVALLRLVSDKTLISAILVGGTFGLLTLTKASFLYICLPAFPILAAFLWKERQNSVWREEGGQRAALGWIGLPVISALVFALICGAWVMRNVIHFNQYAITERGGDILYYRLLKTEQPVLGAVYAWSPRAYRPMIGMLTGYEPKDLKAGEALAALSRGNEESIHRQRWRIYRERMEAAGVPKMSRLEQEKWLGREALREYAANPIHYVKWTPVFAWRGSFAGVQRLNFLRTLGNALPEHVTLLLFLNFLVIGIGSIVLLQPTLGPVFLLPVGMYMFHAMLSHNIPRYNEPLIPYLWLAAFVSVAFLTRVAHRRYLQQNRTRALTEGLYDPTP